MKVYLVLGLMAAFLVACGGDAGAICSDVTQAGSCSSLKSCCTPTGTSCYYRANGKKFSCSGVNCADAAQKALAYCQGGNDTFQGSDLFTSDFGGGGGDCGDAKACCEELVAVYGSGYQAQCDALDTATTEACASALQAWQNAGYCN